jgi:hypothetical protein
LDSVTAAGSKEFMREAQALMLKEVITERLYNKLEAFLNGVDTGGKWSHRIEDRIDGAIARCTQGAERAHGIVNDMLTPKCLGSSDSRGLAFRSKRAVNDGSRIAGLTVLLVRKSWR